MSATEKEWLRQGWAGDRVETHFARQGKWQLWVLKMSESSESLWKFIIRGNGEEHRADHFVDRESAQQAAENRSRVNE